MPSRSDIPHLLALIDDDTSWIRKQVVTELKSFGTSLFDEVNPYFPALSTHQKQQITYVFELIRHEMIYNIWPNWLDEKDTAVALEIAFSQLDQFCSGHTIKRLEYTLDELAISFQKRTTNNSPANLMRFMFEFEGFRPPDSDALHPKFNCLSHVLEHRQGSQLLLSVLAILLGKRLNIELNGLNVPGHFVLVSFSDDRVNLYNTYNRGEAIAQTSVLYLERNFKKRNTSIREMLAQPHEIILQVLCDNIEAYGKKDDDDKALLFTELYENLMAQLKRRNLVG